MCDCVKQVIGQFEKAFPEAEKVEFINQDLITKKLFSSVEIKIAGKKKPLTKYFFGGYCPICGEKYPKWN